MEIDNHDFGKNESEKLPPADAELINELKMLT